MAEICSRGKRWLRAVSSTLESGRARRFRQRFWPDDSEHLSLNSARAKNFFFYHWRESLRIVVTGGAGFLGSHLCEKLLGLGHSVLCIDNLATGNRKNIEHLEANPAFQFRLQDVTQYLDVEGPVDAVAHLASPASPPDYLRLQIQTLKVGSLGTHKALGLAR